MGYPWLKLWTEFASDPQIVLLPEHLQLVYVKLLCICGEYDKERKGWLPSARRIAATLRQTPEQTVTDLGALGETDPDDPEDAPLVERRDGRWFLTGFEARQSRTSSTERSRAHRARLHTGEHQGAPCNADATQCNATCNADATQCNADATTRCTEVEVEEDIDLVVVPAQPPAPVAPQPEPEPTRDPLTAQFYEGLARLGVMAPSQAQAEAYNAIIEDIRQMPEPARFIDDLMAEAAATTSGRITPRWFEAVVDRCIREGRMPGDKRANGNGRDRPTNGATEHSIDEWAAIAAQFNGGRT